MRITSVEQFRELALRGECGNTPRMWSSLDAYLSDPYYSDTLFVTSLRWDNFRVYHATAKPVRALQFEALGNGGLVVHKERGVTARYKDLFCMESPNPKLQAAGNWFQGEWWPSERQLRWDCSGNPWGQQKRSGAAKNAQGIQALMLMRTLLGHDYVRMEELEEKFPTAIIEFTRFGWPMGIYSEPLLIWEVRDY